MIQSIELSKWCNFHVIIKIWWNKFLIRPIYQTHSTGNKTVPKRCVIFHLSKPFQRNFRIYFIAKLTMNMSIKNAIKFFCVSYTRRIQQHNPGVDAIYDVKNQKDTSLAMVTTPHAIHAIMFFWDKESREIMLKDFIFFLFLFNREFLLTSYENEKWTQNCA